MDAAFLTVLFDACRTDWPVLLARAIEEEVVGQNRCHRRQRLPRRWPRRWPWRRRLLTKVHANKRTPLHYLAAHMAALNLNSALVIAR